MILVVRLASSPKNSVQYRYSDHYIKISVSEGYDVRHDSIAYDVDQFHLTLYYKSVKMWLKTVYIAWNITGWQRIGLPGILLKG
jgi:hypothetical protein